MSQSDTVCLETELRKLRPAELYMLGQILNVSDSWKKLMAIIPKEDDASNLPKFNTDHFSMIQQAAQEQRRSAAEIFLSEWGTMGKTRPTLRILLDLLVKAELFRAADYVAGDILNEELPKRPECGPAAAVDVSDEVIRKLLAEKEQFDDATFSESLVFGLSSEIDNDETNNPNAMRNSSLEKNMQSTKLVSSKGRQNENVNESLNALMSDLMKFSSEENVKVEEQIFERQELSSRELPVFLNEFHGTVEQTNFNQEVLSEELPVLLNNSIVILNSNLSHDQMSDSFRLPTSNINRNEMLSAELPQTVVDLRGNNGSNRDSKSDSSGGTENNGNAAQSVLSSKELPITVLEYNE